MQVLLGGNQFRQPLAGFDTEEQTGVVADRVGANTPAPFNVWLKRSHLLFTLIPECPAAALRELPPGGFLIRFRMELRQRLHLREQTIEGR